MFLKLLEISSDSTLMQKSMWEAVPKKVYICQINQVEKLVSVRAVLQSIRFLPCAMYCSRP